MAGELVPLVMIPRFTTYCGAGSFETVPLLVAAYSRATLTVWRGKLVGNWTPSGGSAATFSLVFQGSHDANTWVDLTTAITTPDVSSKVEFDLNCRWLRVSVVLTTTLPSPLVGAITCWAAGSLVRRVE